MATNMPPHNLVEVVSAARHLIKHPDAGLDDLMRFVPGPDLPTGGKIVGLDGIREAYETGRGTFRTRATARVENVTPRRKGIVVTELPWGVGPERVKEKIAELVRGKKLQGITAVDDYTDRHKGLRLVIEVKNGFNPEAILEQLYRLTPLEDTFGINNVALVDGQPRTLGLKELLEVYVAHRLDVVRRRSLFRRTKAPGPAAPRRRPARRDPRHRRGHPGHPHQRRRRRGARAADVGLRPVRDPGQLHPRDAAAPADQVLPDRAGGRAGDAARARSRSSPRSSSRSRCCARPCRDELAEVAKQFGTPRRTVLLESAGAPTTTAVPLEVSDDPCWVLLSSTGLLARTLDRRPAARPTGRGPSTTS